MDARPDSISIRHPRGADAFGVDLVFRGAQALARAEAVARGLADRGVPATRRHHDGGCAVAFGPVTRTTMVLACPGVVW